MLERHEGVEAFLKVASRCFRVATPGALKGEDCAGVRAAQASRIAHRWDERPGRRERWVGEAESVRMSRFAEVTSRRRELVDARRGLMSLRTCFAWWRLRTKGLGSRGDGIPGAADDSPVDGRTIGVTSSQGPSDPDDGKGVPVTSRTVSLRRSVPCMSRPSICTTGGESRAHRLHTRGMAMDGGAGGGDGEGEGEDGGGGGGERV